MNEPPQSPIDDGKAMNIKARVSKWEGEIEVDIQHEMCGGEIFAV